MKRRLTRRELIKYGMLGLGSITLGSGAYRLLSQGASSARADEDLPRTPIKFTPFTQALPVPPPKQGVTTPFTDGRHCVLPSVSGLTAPKFYTIRLRPVTQELIPGFPQTVVWGYDGMYPGPTFRVNHNEPAIVRFTNNITGVNTIVHNHGGHTSSESDGSDSVFPSQVTGPGQSKDFCYGNIAPINPATHQQETSDFASTQWYHDHMMDITGRGVYMGLAGFYLLKDELETGLIANHTLPADAYDIPLVFQDRVFDANAQLVYKPASNEFGGWLGDVFLMNGKAQPFFHVEPRKYRFRLLNGSNARWYELTLSNGQSMLQIGKDSWLLPFGVNRSSIRFGLAERADVIIDFSKFPVSPNSVVYLNNILQQNDGRGPGGTSRPGTSLLKFIVDLPLNTNVPDATITANAAGDQTVTLRPNIAISPTEIVRTRNFEFDDKDGWSINERRFDPNRNDATPQSNTAERWVLENDGGDWQHPIHIHLEAHQVQKINGRTPPVYQSFKSDTTQLGPDGTAEVFIKFRTFAPGRWVFHCHNLEHEDNAMMAAFQVIP